MAHRSNLHLGGSDLSISMLACWWTCPRLFYWRYLHPWPTGQGTEPDKTPSPLLMGSALHEAIEAYLRSGYKDGQYSLDDALAAARACFARRQREFTDEEVYAKDLAKTEALLRNYHAFYGPGGVMPDYPDIQVLLDDQGLPMIERTFTVPLGFGGYQLTVRPDALVKVHSFVCTMEHKSTTASWLNRLFDKMQMDAQAIAQTAILKTLGHPTNGVYINALVKDRAPGSRTKPAFERQLVHYPPHIVDSFLGNVRDGIRQIEDAIGQWETLVGHGLDTIEAAAKVFTMTGLFTGSCVQFSRCSMYALCSAPGREPSTLRGYRVRTYDSPTEEEPI